MKRILLLVPVIMVLLVAQVMLAYANVERSSPEYAVPGEWFTVEVTFTCPEDETNAIGIADTLAGAIDSQVDLEWCSPAASYVRTSFSNYECQNTVEYVWANTYQAGTEITAVYKVILEGEPMDEFTFEGFVLYYIGADPIGDGQLREELPVRQIKIKPDMSYALSAVNSWLSGETSMSEVLPVINAWVS